MSADETKTVPEGAGAREGLTDDGGDAFRFVFVHGLAAVGKYTVATELAKLTPLKLFHNHLVCDTLLSVFEFGSSEFIALREEFWHKVFAAAAARKTGGLIFTFAPETTVSPTFVSDAVRTVQEASGGTARVDFVELRANQETVLARVDTEQRRKFCKLVDKELYEKLLADGSIYSLSFGADGDGGADATGLPIRVTSHGSSVATLPSKGVVKCHAFDTSKTSPTTTAAAICAALGLRRRE